MSWQFAFEFYWHLAPAIVILEFPLEIVIQKFKIDIQEIQNEIKSLTSMIDQRGLNSLVLSGLAYEI